MATNFNMRLDVRKAATNIPQIRLGQGDNQTTLTVEVLNDGKPYEFEPNDALTFTCMRPDGQWVHLSDCLWQEGGKWVCLLDEHVTDAAGLASICYFCIKGADGFTRESTDRFELVIEPSGTGHANLGPYSDQVDRLLREASRVYEQFAQWESAENTRVANETARVAAEQSRATAESVRATSEEDRIQAEEGRMNAEEVRVSAENERITAENSRVEDFVNFQKIVAENDVKVQTIWNAIYSDILANPFTLTFSDLDGVTLTSGVWNAANQRVEC